MPSFITILAASAILGSAVAKPIAARSQAASITPHEQYSSSIGVLGCKIDTNRVAYWPGSVDCDNICVKVSYQDRSVFLLKIDTSGGAYDISYDAWNYLAFGKSATEEPHDGGGITMDYEFVSANECAPLLDNGMLPLAAANSMNYVAGCISQPNSWVASHYKLYNILDPICRWGEDEECALDMSVSSQPSCPSGLGSNAVLNLPVWNIEYGTGQQYLAY